MTQFKVGDKVKCIECNWGNCNPDTVYEIEQIFGGGASLTLCNDRLVYASTRFVLAEQKNQPHKHAEIIKAWADGAEIDVRYPNEGNLWRDCPNPLWSTAHEYRVKPIPKPDTFSYIAVNDDYGVRRFTNLEDAQLYIGHQTEQFTILKLTCDGETGKVKAREIVE